MKKKIPYYLYQAVLLTLYIGLMVFFTVMCLQSGTKSAQSSGAVAEATADVINTVSGEEKVQASDPGFQQFVRKFIGHYSFFVLLGVVSSLFYLSFAKGKKYILVILHFAVGFSFAFLSEFVFERSASGRGASFTDVGIDSLGFITLSAFIVLFYYLWKYMKKKKNLPGN